MTTLLMVVLQPMLLISLLLRRCTLAAQHLLGRLRTVSPSLGALAWPAAGQRWDGWPAVPMVLWALGAGLAAAGITLGVWYFLRMPAETGRRRWLHVPVLVLSVVFSLTLGSLMVWSLATDA